MKTLQSLMSIGLGFLFAWTILMCFPDQPKVSYYTLDAWPLELDDSNLAIIGVGLASPKPKPSVMDATPAPSAKPVMMASKSPAQPVMMAAPSPKPAVAMAMSPSQPVMMAAPSPNPTVAMAMSPSPVSMSPIAITPVPTPSV